MAKAGKAKKQAAAAAPGPSDADEKAFQTGLAFELLSCLAASWAVGREQKGLPEPPVPLGQPAGVSLAFALEVYFKCILLMHGINPERGHKLLDVFQQIERDVKSPDAGKLIRGWYKAEVEKRDWLENRQIAQGGTPTTFDVALASCSKVFEDWRYAYESSSDTTSVRFRNFSIIVATRRFILRERPGWKKHLPDFKAIQGEFVDPTKPPELRRPTRRT